MIASLQVMENFELSLVNLNSIIAFGEILTPLLQTYGRGQQVAELLNTSVNSNFL